MTVHCDGPNAVCRIVDHVCGIPAADQRRLFQAFHRGSKVRQIPGTGLGLLIVKRCVDLHQGSIHFESAEGRGTTFTITLPLFVEAAKRIRKCKECEELVILASEWGQTMQDLDIKH